MGKRAHLPGVGPDIAVPTITMDGKQDPFTPAGNGSAYR
jgi:hypothetical protein